jgi:hypothetical protein
MITDPVTGNVVSFVPLYLMEGEESGEITLRVAPEIEDGELGGTVSPSATILAKIAPGAFQDIGAIPLDMSAYFGSFADVVFKIVAADPLPGVTRVLLSAGIPTQSAAAWRG